MVYRTWFAPRNTENNLSPRGTVVDIMNKKTQVFRELTFLGISCWSQSIFVSLPQANHLIYNNFKSFHIKEQSNIFSYFPQKFEKRPHLRISQ